MTIIIRQVISERDAIPSVFCHDPHFKRRSACRKAIPVHRQPMSFGKVEEHSRIATCGDDPPRRRVGLEPVLFEILLPRHTLHAILSIQDIVCSTVGIEDGWRGSQLLEAASGFPATRAIAGGGQNRPVEGLQFHLSASAYPGEAILLFLVHCNRPFGWHQSEFSESKPQRCCPTLEPRNLGKRQLAAVNVHATEFGAAMQGRKHLARIEQALRVEGAF
jgi:hypothetical protein